MYITTTARPTQMLISFYRIDEYGVRNRRSRSSWTKLQVNSVHSHIVVVVVIAFAGLIYVSVKFRIQWVFLTLWRQIIATCGNVSHVMLMCSNQFNWDHPIALRGYSFCYLAFSFCSLPFKMMHHLVYCIQCSGPTSDFAALVLYIHHFGSRTKTWN